MRNWAKLRHGEKRKESRRDVADVILDTENGGGDADPLFRFVQVEPVDGTIDRQMSLTRQPFIVTLATKWRSTQPVGACADLVDAARHAPTNDELIERYIDEHVPKLSASSSKD